MSAKETQEPKCPLCLRYGVTEPEPLKVTVDSKGHKIYHCTVLGKKFCEHMLEATDHSKFHCIDCDDNSEDCNCNDCMGGIWCDGCNEIVDTECDTVRGIVSYNQSKPKETSKPIEKIPEGNQACL